MKEKFVKITVIQTHLARAMISITEIQLVSSTQLLHVQLVLLKINAEKLENLFLPLLIQPGPDATRKSKKVSLILSP